MAHQISKWRHISLELLSKRIKALPLGTDNPVQFQSVRGLGGSLANGQPSRDTLWRERVAQALSHQPVTPSGNPAITDDAVQVEFDSMLADQQLEDAKRLSGQE